jgi:basic membrane protein A
MPKKQFTRRDAIKAISTVPVVGLAGCLGGDGGDGDGDGDSGDSPTATATPEETVRAAWVYISEVGDLGWSWAHDQGRQAADNQFDWLETSFSEGVLPSDGRQVMDQYTQQGFDIIFGTTFEYMDDMHDLAEENPDTLYEHCSGYLTADNMGRYFGRMYQARYLAGVAAGLLTDEDSMGYVAAFPIPEVVRGINAFTRGARAVNDAVTTKVRWTNTWFDPPTEREAAQSLIDEGVDVMAQHQDSPAAVRAANEADIWATGYDAPMDEFGGDNYVTSPIWHWDVFYEPTLQSVRDDTWESDFYFEGLNAGVVDISDWGPQVPSDVQDTVAQHRTDIENGDLDVWAGTKFEGESDDFLFEEMGSYVEGVEGSVPS